MLEKSIRIFQNTFFFFFRQKLIWNGLWFSFNFFFKHDENFTDAFQNAVHQHRRPPGASTVWDLSESPWPVGDTGRGQLHRPPHSTGAHQERLCHVSQVFIAIRIYRGDSSYFWGAMLSLWFY